METQAICKECGAALGPSSPEGLCPKCLLKAALGTHVGGEAGNPGDASPLPTPAQLAEYFPQLEILEVLGKGGMGVVYKARQPSLDRLVALKILPVKAAVDPGFAERFNREARALAKLSHPNIVAVYDFGQTSNGLHYFIMEFVDGPNLRQVEQSGKLTPREALQVIPQICEALQFAHDEGIVHRDIKPENVLLDKKGRVKIADFGLARILGVEARDTRLTGARDLMGTPAYMAPEQVEHPREVDHRADIYSLGVVFYEMLTGELPLGKFAPPSRKVQVDVRLDDVVLRTLEKEPELRYQQARQVKSAVETIATSSMPPVTPVVRASTPPDEAWRQVKGPAIGLILVGLLNWFALPLILLFIFYWASSVEERDKVLLLLAIPLLLLLLSGVIFLGGLKMKRLEGYRLAVLGSILALLVTPGNLIGLPIGIWALAVLSHRETRAFFAARAGGLIPASPPARVPARGQGWKVAAVLVAGVLLLLSVPIGLVLLSIGIPAFSRARASKAATYLVQGTVVQATTHVPIADAQVTDNPDGAAPDRAPREARTDSAGRYVLRTWKGEHTISVSAPGYEPQMTNLPSFSAGASPVTLNFELWPTGRIPATDEPRGAPEASSTKSPNPEPSVSHLEESVPPVVIYTVPPSGASDVDPGLAELQATFSKPMAAGSYAWCTYGSSMVGFPQTNGPIRFSLDGLTCILPVKLQPGQVYALWLNSETHDGFRDTEGHPAVPYLLIFQTRE